MDPNTGLFLLFAVGVAFWFWLDGLRARELANGICDYACRRANVQFLDGTVCLSRFGLKRDAGGRYRFRRLYRFDFSVNGYERRRGYAILLGMEVETLELDGIDLVSPQTVEPATTRQCAGE